MKTRQKKVSLKRRQPISTRSSVEPTTWSALAFELANCN